MKKLYIVVLIFAFIAFSIPVHATNLNLTITDGRDANVGVNDVNWVAQNFTIQNVNMTLTNITISISSNFNSPAGGYEVKLYEDNGGSPNTTANSMAGALAKGLVSSVTQNTNTTFIMSPLVTYTLLQNHNYWIVMNSSATNAGSNFYQINRYSTDPYPAGTQSNSGNSGGTWSIVTGSDITMTINYTGDIFTPSVTNYTILQTLYTTPISELQSSQINYMINASVNVTNLSAILYYNNDAYTLTKSVIGTIYNFSAIVTSPIVSSTTNILFNLSLQITLANGNTTNYTTTTQSQQVLAIGLQPNACTSSATRILNFTFFDEETNNKFDVPIANSTSDILEANFRVYQNVPGDLGGFNFSYNFSSSNSYVICSLDNQSSFKVDGDIRYYNTTTYTLARFYYFRGLSVNNITQYYNLYLLQDSVSTGIPFTIKESNGVDLASNIVIVVQRQILQNGSYISVGMTLTSSTGQGFIYLHAGTVNYQFLLYKNGILQNTIAPSVIQTAAATNGLVFSLGSATLSDILNVIQRTTGTCPVVGGILTCTYSDPSGSLNISYLTVIKDSVVTKTQVCQISSTNKTGSLSCNLTSQGNGTFYYQLGAYFNDASTGTVFWSIIQDGTYAPGLSAPYGTEGLVFAVVLILIFVMIGSFNPVVSIFMGITALAISVALQMVVISEATLIGVAIVGIITAIKVRG